MEFNPKDLIHQVSPFSAKLFNLLSYYNKDIQNGEVDRDVVKIFDAFIDRPYMITSEVIQGVVQIYIDTKDRNYLVEAAALILMLDHKHEMETYNYE